MNKNDKLHNGTAPELNDDELDTVSGGASIDLKEWSNDGPRETWCSNCNAKTWHDTYWRHLYNKFQICKVCGHTRGGHPLGFG